MTPTVQPPTARRRTRRYWMRFIIRLGIIVLLLVVGVPGLLGFATTYILLNPACGDNATTPGDYGYRWEDITLFASDGGQSIRAFFIPGTNRAAIIIPPPYGGGRSSRLHEADVLARHGYAVLTFESRRCAGMGSLSLGYKEVNEVGDALRYLLARDDIDPARIGILGFSSAGATSVMATARFSEIHALVAEGGYGDFAEGALGLDSTQPDSTFLETLYKQSIRLSYRLLTGVSIEKLSPLDVIGTIQPRPILLIYGSTERSLAGAYRQLAAAGDNAELWVVEGAGHGNYLEIAPAEYERRIVNFFDQALLDKR